MKSLIFAFLILNLFNCTSDKTINFVIQDTELSFKDDVNFLPDEYFDGSHIIFKNEGELERAYSIELETTEVEKTFEGQKYSAEDISISIRTPNVPNFEILVEGQISYVDETGDTRASISVALIKDGFPNFPSNLMFMGQQQANAEVLPLNYSDFFDNISFLEKEFSDVYQFTAGGFGYSEWNVNATQGVISFKDLNDEYWVFERFEK